MLKVLILHGWHGSDAPHWQAWLAQELVLQNCVVSFPQLSENLRPDKETWLGEALAAFEELRPDIVIAHSLGNILWLHLCERLNTDVRKLLLCAPPRDLSDYPDVKTFFPVTLPASLHAEEALMVASDDDPYMSVEEAQTLASELRIPLHLLSGAGHINTAAGFGPWPWVKEWVMA